MKLLDYGTKAVVFFFIVAALNRLFTDKQTPSLLDKLFGTTNSLINNTLKGKAA